MAKAREQYLHIDEILDFVLEENDADIPLGDSDSNILDSDGEWEYETENMKDCNNSENVNNSIEIEKPGPSGFQLANEDVIEPVYREISNTNCETEIFEVLSSTRIYNKGEVSDLSIHTETSTEIEPEYELEYLSSSPNEYPPRKIPAGSSNKAAGRGSGFQ